MATITTYRKITSPGEQVPMFDVAYDDTHGYIIDNVNIYFKCSDMCIRAFNRTTGELRFTLGGHAAKIACLSITGNILLSIDTDIIAKRWNTDTGECISTVALKWEKTDYANRPVHRKKDYIQVAYAYNDEIIGACSDGIIRVWTHDSEATRFAYLSNVAALLVHNDIMFTSSREQKSELRVWDFKRKTQIMWLTHHGSADETSFMSIAAINDTLIAGDYHGNIVSWNLKHRRYGHGAFMPMSTLEPQNPSYRNIHKSPILALHCQNDVLTAGKYITTSDASSFLSWHIIDSKKQAFTSLLCMQRLDYPPEIVHEIMSHFHIVPHSAVNTYSATGTFA